MAITTDLTGLGMAAALASRVGHAVSTVAGTTTTQTGGAQITTSVTIGTTGSGQTAFVLPTAKMVPPMLKEFYFFNSTATSALVFPAGDGSTLNGSTSASITVAQNKYLMAMCVSGTGTSAPQWLAGVSA